MNTQSAITLFGLLLAAMPLFADDTDDSAVRALLAERLPGVIAENIRRSPVPGLYEVILGPRVLYVSGDGRYVLQGTVMDLAEQANITEPRRLVARAAWVNGMDESQMVVFEPTTPLRHTLTVFTDVDCGYCRQMHAEIDQLLAAGIRVRYLLYSRGGPGTEAASKAEQVWCSEDQRAALTAAKQGRTVTAPACETPIMANLLLGRELPVNGTPTMVSGRGDLIPGYLPPAMLVEELQRLSAAR
ncbi:MAG: DsbC family protein [Xanthomonadaceae bacterium]|nr:DsbC family protein [Xanthomonadaceae bacterium]